MNDTTKWIMIILLLLLIAAAVFMLLRSPGKDDGDADAGVAAGHDADRDGVPDAREDRIEPAEGRADRGVYDQEADTAPPAAERMEEYAHPDAIDDRNRRGEPVEAETYEDTTTAPVETAHYDDTSTTPVDVPPAEAEDRSGGHGATVADDTVAPDSAEPYRPEAGAVEDDQDRAYPADATTDVHTLTDEEITEGGRQEPLVRDEQAPAATSDEQLGDEGDHGRTAYADADRDGPDLTAAAAAGAAGAAAAGGASTVQDDRDRDSHEEHTVGDDSTTYRATDGDAVVVDEDRRPETSGWTDTQAGRDAEPADAGWDAPPADAGTGAPRTADEIVESRDHDAAAPVFTEAAYGPGSAEPLEDGSGPAGWEVKGNVGSMLFHTTESPSYDSVRAEVWFENEDAARSAGFAHWDRRRR